MFIFADESINLLFMRHLFFALCLSVTFGAFSQSIPEVTATIPVSLDDRAPVREAYLYSRDFAGVKINDDGSLSRFSGSDYVEIGYSGPCEMYINGLAGNMPQYWQEAYMQGATIDPKNSYFVFGRGTKALVLDDGTELFLYPAQLKKGLEGEYRIAMSGKGNTFHNPGYGVSLSFIYDENHDYDEDELKYPYSFIQGREENYSSGFAYFTRDGSEYIPYDNSMVCYTKMLPTDVIVSYPPADAEYVTCQMTSDAVSALADIREEGFEKQGRFVTAVYTDDAVYLRNVFPEGNRLWLKGYIEGDKVRFRRGDVVAGRSMLGRLGTYTGEMAFATTVGTRCCYMITPSDEDLLFSYDAASGRLYDSSVGFMASYDINVSDEFNYDSLMMPIPVYVNAEISRFEDVPMCPQTPADISGYDEMYYGYSGVQFYITDIDTSGRLMDTSLLFYRIKVDGEPVVIGPEEWPSLTGPTSDIPFNYLNDDNVDHGYNCEIDGFKRRFSLRNISSIDRCKIEVEMVYYGGGKENFSGKAYLGADMISTDAVEEDTRIFDLQGREVERDGLAPGVYISKGKKFVVR